MDQEPRFRADDQFELQVSAEVLKKMKKTAEDFLGEEVTGAVITALYVFHL